MIIQKKNKKYKILLRVINKIITILRIFYNYIITHNTIFLINDIGEGNKFDKNITIHKPEKLKIGNENFFGENVHLIANGGIEIGNKCAIAADCKFITRQHTYGEKDIFITDQIGKKKPIKIGDDCWFGYNCIVLPGVTLGKGCVVAAGAVVNRSFDDYSVIGGVPAKILKKR
jgi:galactoside O-acetyltransferase